VPFLLAENRGKVATAWLIASSSLCVIGDLPFSLRQTLL
jgi:hypothetical protein